MTSSLMTLVSERASLTSVETALSSSTAARSLRGLKLFLSTSEKSSAPKVCWAGAGLVVSRLSSVAICVSSPSGLFFGLAVRGLAALAQGLHQRRIGQQFLELDLGR